MTGIPHSATGSRYPHLPQRGVNNTPISREDMAISKKRLMATPVTAYRYRASQGVQGPGLFMKEDVTRESAVHREDPHYRRARRDVAQLRRPPRGQQADTCAWM